MRQQGATGGWHAVLVTVGPASQPAWPDAFFPSGNAALICQGNSSRNGTFLKQMCTTQYMCVLSPTVLAPVALMLSLRAAQQPPRLPPHSSPTGPDIQQELDTICVRL